MSFLNAWESQYLNRLVWGLWLQNDFSLHTMQLNINHFQCIIRLTNFAFKQEALDVLLEMLIP
jgi:hypothetical protein